MLALRLGWAVAETRGRYRLWDDARLGSEVALPSRTQHSLPLADERSAGEQRIEALRVLESLAAAAGVDIADYRLLTRQTGPDPAPASARLTELALALDAAHDRASAPEVARAWDGLAGFLYSWDAYIQDHLASGPFGAASAYQLGRSLAETYWALDPAAGPDSPASWEFLLGDHRRSEIKRLLARLGGRFDPVATRAVTWALDAWWELAADPDRRRPPETLSRLSEQVRVWRDLLLAGEDPAILVDPHVLLSRSRQIRGVLRSFWPEILLLVLGVVGLAGAAYVLVGRGDGHTVAAAVAVLASSGGIAAGVAAWAKNLAHGVLENQRHTLYQEAVNAAATLCPPPPKKRARHTEGAHVER